MNKPQINTDAVRIKRMVALLNMLPNVCWSFLNLAPIFVFCYRNMPVNMVYFFSATGVLAMLLPQAFFNRIQIGNSTIIYKKIGVTFINKFTQNGYFINALIRKKFPGYSIITHKHASHKKLLQQTFVFEKFHFGMFVLFTFTTVFALMHKYLWWSLVISITNILYNVYPNFLQQYIRIRLMAFRKKRM